MRDISYKDYNRRNDIHGTVLYPAVMIAPMQKEILAGLIDTSKVIKIIDPFHGSGIALYESSAISQNVELFGCDINPLANLITKVKLQGVTHSISSDIEKLETSIESLESTKIHTFPNIAKWYREDIILSMSILKQAISGIEDIKNRQYFWYCFIDIARKYSNTRSSTYKLHTKEKGKIANIENFVIRDYISIVKKNYSWFLNCNNVFTLEKKDTLTCLQAYSENQFDICVTSPPYGDNATTVPYGQFSMLALHWIDERDLELEGWEKGNYSSIDSRSLGGPRQCTENQIEFNESLIAPLLNRISEKKQLKVVRFFRGYFEFLEQVSRITREYVVITLGNRTVDGVSIDLTTITKTYLERCGYSLLEVSKRDILSKRIPKLVSQVNQKPVSSMNEEFVLVMKKDIHPNQAHGFIAV